jgi:hypothetical protein
MTNLEELSRALVESSTEVDKKQSWQLRPATVTVAGEVTAFGRFDGDGVADQNPPEDVPLISLVSYVDRNQRVMVLSVPPAGNYIVSRSYSGEGSEWIEYTPVISASTPPSVGAGSIAGRWRVTGLRTIEVEVQISFGAGATQGAGSYTISAPFPTTTRGSNGATGACLLVEAGVIRAGIVVFANVNEYLLVPDGTGIVGAGNPGVWSDGDTIRFSLSHEIESFS